MCSFSQGEFENFLRHIAAFRSDHQFGADVLLKLLALDQLLRTNEQDEGALGSTEHTVDLVDTDVAVLGGLLGDESQLEVNGNSFDLMQRAWAVCDPTFAEQGHGLQGIHRSQTRHELEAKAQADHRPACHHSEGLR